MIDTAFDFAGLGSATDTVNVSGDTGIVPYASNAGSKTNALLIEVPQSISIVSGQELKRVRSSP